ncbi:MAG: DNA-3-methyladenine glycosylase [Bacteroidales bacterium]|nr:DNA-3-methyladenine glycosylase [Bacteroidales bacterium]
MENSRRLQRDFFTRDVLEVAPELLNKSLVLNGSDGIISRYIITETEAYRGAEDKACHASKGRTDRTEVMYNEGGSLYVYLIYGIHWMLNVVTGLRNNPQAALIRSLKNITGPGRVTKALKIDKSFNGEDLTASSRIWIEDIGITGEYKASERIGIDYAGEYWKTRPWRFYL